MPPRFQKVVIYGVGLLGGSLGMALRRRAMAGEIVGLGRSLERLERARQLGAIDKGLTRAAEALDGADAVVLAIPPRQIRERLAEIGSLMGPGTFLTDIGSVKARIVEEARRVLPPEARFIGSHPMAGSEKSGVEFSRSDFYEGSACILTPDESTDPALIELGRAFWTALGARVMVMDPERHDRVMAGISHMPHLLASALMQTLSRSSDLTDEEMGAIAGGGLKDMTRIAASDPEMWRQIFGENPQPVLDWLDQLQRVIDEWRAALQKPDGKAIGALFSEGNEARQKLNDE